MKRLRQSLWAALLLIAPWTVCAHELSIAELHVREMSPGQFQWNWGAGGMGRQPQDELKPLWPEGCTATAETLACSAGLVGEIGMEGIGTSYSAAMLKLRWLDGARVYTITESQPSVQVFGSAQDRRGGGQIALAYTILGVEHILGGIDHLLFVICLLFLVGFGRQLVWTITAFTVAHSLTLICSALGWLTLRSAPVEAVIAMSIVLMAAEALRREDTLTRRLPALVAFGFGLVHGLGFAGALTEIGLPENHLLLALLTFNLGVELGQLLTVAAAFALVVVLRRFAWAMRLNVPVLYGIGAVAAYWSWGRVAAIFL